MKFVILAIFLLGAVSAVDIGIYAILSNQTGNAIEILRGDRADNVILTSNTFDESNKQLFHLNTVDRKFYVFTNQQTKKLLTVADHQASNIVQRNANGNGAQQFEIIRKPDGLVAIQNRVTGKFLTVRGKNEAVYQENSNGQRTQLFRLIRVDAKRQVKIEDGATYAFFNSAFKTALDIHGISKDAGAKLAAYGFWGGQNQYFFIRGSFSNPTHVRIWAIHSGKVLTAHRGFVTQENRIHGKDAQLWSFFEGDNGAYTIENKATKQVLTLDARQGAVATQRYQRGNKQQQFHAVRIN